MTPVYLSTIRDFPELFPIHSRPRAEVGIRDPFEGVLDVLARHLTEPVGPFDARHQAEADVSGIERLDRGGGFELPAPVGGHRVVGDELVEDSHHYVLVGSGGRIARIDVLDVGCASHAQHLVVGAEGDLRGSGGDEAERCRALHELATGQIDELHSSDSSCVFAATGSGADIGCRGRAAEPGRQCTVGQSRGQRARWTGGNIRIMLQGIET